MATFAPAGVLCTTMKQIITLSLALSASVVLQAQTSVTVSTAAGISDQVWYSLQNGEVDNAPLAEWDLAFEMTGFTSSILVNTAKGLVVYETPSAIGFWDNVNTLDSANWTRIDNSDTSWSAGALTHGNNLVNPDGLNVGWGDYNMATHVIAGSRIYAIQLADATTWLKLRINSLSNGVFSFTYANLDGTGSHDATLVKTDFTGKNFGYWSFETNATLDREPATTDWDLLFTKYIGFVPTAYPVAGVLQNKGVTALQVDDVPTADAEWTSAPFSTEMNIIGSDWKSYDFDLNAYTTVPDRTYFVKDGAGNIWKLVFTAFGGSTTGDMTFEQELVSSTGIAEAAARQGTLLVQPNPVTDGNVELVMDVPAHEGTLQVYNAAGQLMMDRAWKGTPGLSVRGLDVSGLSKGLYTVRFSSSVATVTAKLAID